MKQHIRDRTHHQSNKHRGDRIPQNDFPSKKTANLSIRSVAPSLLMGEGALG
jgi:hypothetical protein